MQMQEQLKKVERVSRKLKSTALQDSITTMRTAATVFNTTLNIRMTAARR